MYDGISKLSMQLRIDRAESEWLDTRSATTLGKNGHESTISKLYTTRTDSTRLDRHSPKANTFIDIPSSSTPSLDFAAIFDGRAGKKNPKQAMYALGRVP